VNADPNDRLGTAAQTAAVELDVLEHFTQPVHDDGVCELKIATYNIHGGLPAWTAQSKRQMASRVAHVIAELDADIVAMQEVPLGGSETPDLLSQLREATGMFAVEGATLDTPKRRYGNAVLSRFPVRAARTLDLSFHRREPRGALDADIECGGQLIRVVATHLGLSASERSTQVRTLLAAFDNSELPVILVGDINEWFVRGRALRALVSHFRPAPAPRTFPTVCPVFALDRIWMHPGECLIDVTVHRSAFARKASDHYPLVARIHLPAHGRRPLVACEGG
jgi:endonuclease/exonuclease/phosphatase family metal-dependent hydrolase